MKKYLNISEVSKIVGIKEHTIRYWDSVNPKTDKIRIEGISTKSKAGTRYFNSDNLKKLQKLKSLIYNNGDHNPSLNLAEQIISSKRKNSNFPKNTNFISNPKKLEKIEKIDQILKKMRILLK
tara:strand:- start:165 stop:533 length:369 start_codon:yes stop_codon:yes gene_type:complete